MGKQTLLTVEKNKPTRRARSVCKYGIHSVLGTSHAAMRVYLKKVPRFEWPSDTYQPITKNDVLKNKHSTSDFFTKGILSIV